MATYLLLRDNKQTGPYTFDELTAKGFKAYDLVWIEGKSAAWRYPGEIEEFKLLAPPVEEQPYDRFYKRSSQPSHSITSSVIQDHINENHPADKVIREINKNDSSRTIYVNLPVTQKSNATQQNGIEKGKSQEPVKKEPETRQVFSVIANDAGKQMPAFSGDQENYLYARKEPAGVTTHYADALKTDRVIKTKKTRPKYLMFSVAAVLLLASGVAIGLLISRNSFGSAEKNNASNPVNNTQLLNQDENKIATIPVSTSVNPAAQNLVRKDSTIIINTIKPNEEEKKAAANINDNTKKKTVNSSKEKTDYPAQINSSATALPATKDSDNTASSYLSVTRREATHRSDVNSDKDNGNSNHTTSLINLVSVAPNKYNVGTFGGISDLQLTVNNQSTHNLDLVVVEVQYIQANKKIFKTENIYFRNIAAGSSLMQGAPSSSRGIKVQYRVTIINAKDQGLSYSAL